MRKQLSTTELFTNTVQSMWAGLRLTLKHFFQAVNRREQVGVADERYFRQPDGVVTNLYPYEAIPVPDNGRYRLHNEIEDCIVCDLCAKVCPVNCIDIEPIKSPEEIGKTSDGSTKRIYAAKFDIDMAKCCYCGLCTTVCPTECLTMTKTYDFSEYDVRNMVYHFAELSPEQAVQKKAETERKAADEKAKKEEAAVNTMGSDSKTEIQVTEQKPAVAKPAFKPKISIPPVKKPDASPSEEQSSIPKEAPIELPPNQEQPADAAPKPVFKPKIVIPSVKKTEASDSVSSEDNAASKTDTGAATEEKPAASKPVFKPKIIIPPKKKEEGGEDKQ